MIISATELKNNLGKYLRDCVRDRVIITSNGRKIAVLCSYEINADFFEPFIDDGVVSEKEAEAFNLNPKKMSYEEFLELAEASEKRYEYIDGEVYLLTAPGTMHQKILGELYILFYYWSRGKKCVPMLSPYDITLKKSPKDINVVEPDLVVICDLEEHLNQKDRYMGVPVLAVEILSESTRSRDTVKKLDLFMSSGVKEYWIVDPFEKEVAIYSFENNEITRIEKFKKEKTAVSCCFPDLKIKLKNIF